MKRKFFNFSLLASVGLLVFGATGCSELASEPPAIKLSYSSLEMEVGQTKQIKVSVDKDYANFPVRWFTNNENVAFFRDNSVGYVTAVGEGKTTVTAGIGGAFADCVVTVTSNGGDPDAARFTMQSAMELTVGDSKKLSYSVNPAGSTITFTSSAPSVADVNSNGTVQGLSAGSAEITAVAVHESSSITRKCTVTVKEEGGGGEGLDDGIPEGLTFPAGSTLLVGSPDNSASTMQTLIDYFRNKTGITAAWTISKFEEGKGAGNFPSGAASGPDVFPFVSDQTMTLNNLGALNQIDKDSTKEYKKTMLDGAVTAATWNDIVLGYPFAADNGVVMFYDKQAVGNDPSVIDTVDKLFTLAGSKGLKVGYALTNGFYGAGILHTFNNGQSMFQIEATNTSYRSSSTFNTDNGVKALEVAHKIMKEGDGGYGLNWNVQSKAAPGTNNLLATIIDTSNVREFREAMGDRYGVAPLPYVDENRSERLCTYLGYKFYGVNGQCANKTLAHAFARFLASEYAQNLRYEREKTQPTLRSLQHICADEPHIAALNAQKASGSTLLLSIFGDEYFNNTAVTLTDLLNDYSSEGINPTEAQYKALLKALDSSWK